MKTSILALVAWSLCLAFPAPTHLVTSQQAGKYVGFLVGVDNYQKDPQISRLRYPVRDVSELAPLLTMYAFEPQHIISSQNPDKQAFGQKVRELRRILAPSDRLLVYFSGHGLVKNNKLYWLPTDAVMSTTDQWIDVEQFLRDLDRTACKQILLIIDSCHGGAIFNVPRTKGVPVPVNASPDVINRYSALRSGTAISSGTDFEEVPDESHFFEALKSFLQENTEQHFLASYLFANIREIVYKKQSQSNFTGVKITPQYSKVTCLADSGGEFLFYKPTGTTGTSVVTKMGNVPLPSRELKAQKNLEVGIGTPQVTLTVQKGQTIQMQASGLIVVGMVLGTVTPEGKMRGPVGNSLSMYNIKAEFPHGALLYRLSPKDPWKKCGNQWSFEAPYSGMLTIQFTVNDNDQGNNSGAFNVSVETL